MTFDPQQFKERQRQAWDQAAPGWKKWDADFVDAFGPISEAILAAADLHPGDQVLDIATGTGEPALTAARLVGPSGRVLGTDISPQMLAVAEERAAKAGAHNVSFQVADAEALNLPPGSFDVALCRLGLMFLPNLPGALAGIREVLRPGGKLVAAVWSTPDKHPSASLAMRVMQEMITVPPPPPGSPNIFSLAAPGLLEQRLKEAGFRSVRCEPVAFTLTLESANAYVELLQDTAGVINLVQKETPERQAEVWRAISDAARAYATPDGRIRFPAEVLIGVGVA